MTSRTCQKGVINGIMNTNGDFIILLSSFENIIDVPILFLFKEIEYPFLFLFDCYI